MFCPTVFGIIGLTVKTVTPKDDYTAVFVVKVRQSACATLTREVSSQREYSLQIVILRCLLFAHFQQPCPESNQIQNSTLHPKKVFKVQMRSHSFWLQKIRRFFSAQNI